jgi:hypothetical protein
MLGWQHAGRQPQTAAAAGTSTFMTSICALDVLAISAGSWLADVQMSR